MLYSNAVNVLMKLRVASPNYLANHYKTKQNKAKQKEMREWKKGSKVGREGRTGRRVGRERLV